jgi:hypothetical protein
VTFHWNKFDSSARATEIPAGGDVMSSPSSCTTHESLAQTARFPIVRAGQSPTFVIRFWLDMMGYDVEERAMLIV